MKKLLLIGLIVLASAGCVKESTKNDDQTENQQQESKVVEFSHSYTTGFEGENYKIDAKLSYPEDKFKVSAPADRQNKIVIEEVGTGKKHEIQIFNNQAAGFTSAKHIWDEHWKAEVACNDCRSTEAGLTVPGTDKAQAYENDTYKYVIYAHDPGFIMYVIQKGSDDIEDVLESFQVSSKRI